MKIYDSWKSTWNKQIHENLSERDKIHENLGDTNKIHEIYVKN